MDKNSYKIMISDLMTENQELKKQNQNLKDVLLSLRNEYINQGGDPNQLEIFDPERISRRILGLGDIVGLVEEAQKSFDNEESRKCSL